MKLEAFLEADLSDLKNDAKAIPTFTRSRIHTVRTFTRLRIHTVRAFTGSLITTVHALTPFAHLYGSLIHTVLAST